jgi:hypothetical protein
MTIQQISNPDRNDPPKPLLRLMKKTEVSAFYNKNLSIIDLGKKRKEPAEIFNFVENRNSNSFQSSSIDKSITSGPGRPRDDDDEDDLELDDDAELALELEAEDKETKEEDADDEIEGDRGRSDSV